MLKFDRKKVYEVAVISTMSSGKSTFINSLIGERLLPSKNQACTIRTTAVLDNDHADSVTGHILFEDDRYEKLLDCQAADIERYVSDSDSTIKDIILECSIPGIRNIQKSLLIVDTPGANNSSDLRHEAITAEYLQKMSVGTIAYLMNATQLGTDDDSHLLQVIRKKLESTPTVNILFIVNKADELDPSKMPIENTVKYCLDYLQAQGFASPRLLLVSAEAGLLFKMALAGREFTRYERNKLEFYFEQFYSPKTGLGSYAVGESISGDEPVKIGTKLYRPTDILDALENTGLPMVEREIENQIINTVLSEAPVIQSPKKISLMPKAKAHTSKPGPQKTARKKKKAGGRKK